MNTIKTIEDFKRQAKEKGIVRWHIHECSGCNYQCGFVLDLTNDALFYDNGCYCVFYPPTQRNWQDLPDHYNMQTSKEYINEMDEFWGFKNGGEK